METYSAIISEKRKVANKVTHVDKEDQIISETNLVSEEINSFFQNATKNLDINENSYIKHDMKLMNIQIQLKKPFTNT